jgi:hypothetical protein
LSRNGEKPLFYAALEKQALKTTNIPIGQLFDPSDETVTEAWEKEISARDLRAAIVEQQNPSLNAAESYKDGCRLLD